MITEKKTLQTVCKEQKKALRAFSDNQHEQERRQKFEKKLENLKAEYKILQEEKLQLTGELNVLHNQLIKNRIYIRNMKKNIDIIKHKKPGCEKIVVTDEDLREQEIQIEKMKELHQKIQKDNEMKLLEYEKQKKEL